MPLVSCHPAELFSDPRGYIFMTAANSTLLPLATSNPPAVTTLHAGFMAPKAPFTSLAGITPTRARFDSSNPWRPHRSRRYRIRGSSCGTAKPGSALDSPRPPVPYPAPAMARRRHRAVGRRRAAAPGGTHQAATIAATPSPSAPAHRYWQSRPDSHHAASSSAMNGNAGSV